MSKSARSVSPTSSDLHRLLDAAARLADLSSVDPHEGTQAFCEHAITALNGTLEHGFASCEMIGLTAGPPCVLAAATRHPMPVRLYRRLKELLPMHPLMRAWLAAGCDGVQWTGPRAHGGQPIHATALYDEVFRHSGIEAQALPSVRLGSDRSLTAMMSSDRAFTRRELKVLDLLRPHLAAAWRSYEALIAAHAASATAPTPVLDVGGLQRRFGLPRRRAEVLALLVEGTSNRAIAAKLGLSVGTVRKHVELLLTDLGVSDRHEAARMVRANTAGAACWGSGSDS